MRSRGHACLSALSPPPLAAIVRSVVAALSALLPAEPGEPQSRPAFAAVVRAEPSRRGFRRDFCGVAAAALAMAHALCRLAGAQEARICRRTDGARSPASGRCSRIGKKSIRSSKLTQTLGDYYKKKRALYVVDTPKTYDRDLRRLFSDDPKHRRSEAASCFHQAQPRHRARTGREMDRRISAHIRRRARRHDPAMPRTQFARGRSRAQTDHGIHGAVDRENHAYIVRSVAAKVDRAMKRLRVLVLVHPDLIPPESIKGYTEQEINVWKTEYDVVSTLRAAGHEVRPLGVHDELKPIRDAIDAFKPDAVFTLLEQFQGEAIYDQNVASYLELLARALHRLQSARPDAGARQGFVENAGSSSSRSGAGLRGLPQAPQGQAAVASAAAADRQKRERGCVLRHFAGVRRRYRREADRARRLSSTSGSAPRRSPSNISRAAKSMSASSATTGCWCCRCGNCGSRIWRMATG